VDARKTFAEVMTRQLMKTKTGKKTAGGCLRGHKLEVCTNVIVKKHPLTKDRKARKVGQYHLSQQLDDG